MSSLYSPVDVNCQRDLYQPVGKCFFHYYGVVVRGKWDANLDAEGFSVCTKKFASG